MLLGYDEGFGHLLGVAVDSEGDVYALERVGENQDFHFREFCRIDKFSNYGYFLKSWSVASDGRFFDCLGRSLQTDVPSILRSALVPATTCSSPTGTGSRSSRPLDRSLLLLEALNPGAAQRARQTLRTRGQKQRTSQPGHLRISILMTLTILPSRTSSS